MQNNNYQANYLGLESSLETVFEDGWIRVLWNIEKLGDAFRGAYWLVQNPVLSFESETGETTELRLLGGEPSRATICGKDAFRRMRGAPMPDYPLSYAVALPRGIYSLRFTAEVYDCRRLVHYCDALQIFAGDFGEVVHEFETDVRYWHQKRHAEAGEPFRFTCDLELGTLSVPKDYLDTPYYHVLNEAELPEVQWDKALPLVLDLKNDAPLQPQNYFEAQLKSGIGFMRANRFCRYGTHCTEAPLPRGSGGTGMRPFAMWGQSFTLHYILTGDEQSGEAAAYSVNMVNGFLEQGPNPWQQHVLPTGIACAMLLRYARSTDNPGLLERYADLWHRWPYDWNRHNPATEPAEDGSDLTANDTYNMKLAGASAMWLMGKYLNDAELMEKGRDCVLNFVLPGFVPEGYWFYRPGSPEGDMTAGIQANNHYDGFVKMMLARLLMHEEWRAEPGVLDILRRGMDFSLRELVEDDGRILKWELHRNVQYAPREILAKHIGHAGMFCEPLYLLARYCDPAYLAPLQRSLQYVYDLRDDERLKDYWDNSWLYSVYGGLFTLSSLGVNFEGAPDALQLSLGNAGTVLL